MDIKVRKDKVMAGTAVGCTIITLLLVTVMAFYMGNRTITYANVGQLMQDDKSFSEKIERLTNEPLTSLPMSEKTVKSSIIVPVTDTITADQLLLNVDLMKRDITLFVNGITAQYYLDNPIILDQYAISKVEYACLDDTLKLVFHTNAIYECEINKEYGYLTISLTKPEDIYSYIVAVDIGHGDSDAGECVNNVQEKEVLLNVAKAIKALHFPENIGIYFTRMSDINLTDEERLRFITDIGADALISIHLSESEDTNQFGLNAYYNANYYSQGFQCVDYADTIIRNTAMATLNRANGLYAADADSLISKVTIKATELELGYITNLKEASFLSDSEYQKKLALGIYNGIMEAYQIIKASEEVK